MCCGCRARSPGQSVLRCPKHPEDFQGKVYKDRVREGACDTCDQFVDMLQIMCNEIGGVLGKFLSY